MHPEEDDTITHTSIDTAGGYTVGRRGRHESWDSFITYHHAWARGYTFTTTPEPSDYVLQFPHGDPTGHEHTLNRVARQMVIELGAGDPGELHGIVDFSCARDPFGPMTRDEVYQLKRVYAAVCRRLDIDTGIDPDVDLWPIG